jgi:serine/threonine protein phosphatase PrpC
LKPEEQSVIAFPEVKIEKFDLSKDKENEKDEKEEKYNIMVLACDGLWDVMKNEGNFHIKNLIEVYEFITKKINEQKEKDKDIEIDLEKISKDIVNYSISDRKSQDNVTCIIIMFNN